MNRDYFTTERCFWCMNDEIVLTLKQKVTKKCRSACKYHKLNLIFWSIMPIYNKKYEFGGVL